MQKSIGLLLVAGGVALLLLLKKGLRRGRGTVHRREVVVGPKQGVCGLLREPSNVTMRRNEQLHWIIRNEGGHPCDRHVEVCIENWRPGNPLEIVGGGRFCRKVLPGHAVPLPARVRPNAEPGRYRYDVWIDGKPAVDPMVDIVI
jgi:hypothetical protein